MKDAAILTKFYKNYNYGGMLQGYALHKAITDLGYSVDLVSYDVGANPNPVYPGLKEQIKQYSAVSAVQKAGEKAVGKCRFMISDLLAERRKMFDRFMQDMGANTDVYDDANSDALTDRYKAFISGSDQVWNPNAVRNLYLQTFIDNPDRKISYAASIGRDSLSEREASVLIPAIRRFGSISVREKTAAELLGNYIDVPVVNCLDPTMLLSAQEWDEAASKPIVSGKYALVYFFSDSLAVRTKAEEFCSKHGMKMVLIPYAKQEYNLTDAVGPGERVAKVGPREFVSLIKGAEFVLTDSFHGAVFSLIYGIPFAVFERNRKGHVSMNSRLYDLLDLFEQSYRLTDVRHINELDNLYESDRKKISAVMEREKEHSLSFLRTALQKAVRAADEDQPVSTVSGEEDRCTGCGACEAVCPAGCISLDSNRNGFAVPVIDEAKCLHCGKCLRACPVQGRSVPLQAPCACYGAYTVNESEESASGGISGALVKRWTQQGDIAYGAAYGEDLHVHTVRAVTPEETGCFSGSKYIQADMKGVIGEVLRDLSAGKRVLFTGTPCQIAGVRAAVRESCPADAEKLYTAEIICHGTPSPALFRSYLEWIWEKHGQRVEQYRFRSREESGRDFMVRIGFEDGSHVTKSGFKDPYYRLFMSSAWFRKSCYVCPFSQKERAADVTLGDFWNSEKLPASFGRNRRISVVLVNTPRGEELFNLIAADITSVETDWETAAQGNANLKRPTPRPDVYREFGDVRDTGVFFDREAAGKINRGKYWFNRLPQEWRRTLKRGMGGLRKKR